MQVEFTEYFLKSVKKINQSIVKNKIKTLIIQFENAKSLQDIPNVKKMVGYSYFYRCRLGNYRLGFQYKDDVVTFLIVAHKSRIYKIFP